MTQHETIILRDMIDGELNRIAVSKDKNEIDVMYDFLRRNIEKYYKAGLERVSKIKQ